MTGRSRRQLRRRGNESAGVAAPGMATTNWALEAVADGVCVTIKRETAARIEDVLESPAADANFQHAPIKTAFKVEVVAKG